MMNPMLLMKAKERLELFQKDHPKFFLFLQMLKNRGLEEGTIFELKVTMPDGQTHEASIRLTANDIESVRMFADQKQ